MGFLDKAFETVVIFSAVDRLTAPMEKMATQMGIMDKKSQDTLKTLNQYKNLAWVGAGVTAVGVAIATGLYKAAEAAGELQMNLMGVKSALGLTSAEFDKAINLAQKVGIPTIFSSTQVGGIMQAMATSGLTKQAILTPDILTKYVDFADVQAQIKKENPNDVVAMAVKMAHQYQLYSPEQVGPFLDQLNAVLLNVHDTASEFQTTYRYIAGTGKMMGMSSTDALATTAWMSRMGLGSGRGGTGFQDFLQRSIYGSSGNKADEAMLAAGFVKDGHSVFEDAKGVFVGIPAAVQIMQDFGKRFGNNANAEIPLLKAIFGMQGERVAMAMTSSGAGEQYNAVKGQIQDTPSIIRSQIALNDTWQGQMRQMQTTLTDIVQAFGKYVLPQFLPFLKNVNYLLADLLDLEQNHPTLMKIAVGFAAIASAVSLIAGPSMIFMGLFKYLQISETLVSGIKLIGSAFKLFGSGILSAIKLIPAFAAGLWSLQLAGGPILWIIEAIVLACALVWLAWRNNWGHIHEHFATFIAWIKPLVDWLVNAWDRVKSFVVTVFNGHAAAVPAHATGTNYAPGGWSLVGERGPELVNLPRGSQVIPNDRLGSGGNGAYFEKGAIAIYSNQDPKQIAREVMKEIAKQARNQSYGRPAQVIPVW